MSTSNPQPIFIGIAWPYVNGDMHIGHYGGCLLPGDVSARYFRAKGHPVLMVSGSDCHGTPITVEADARKITPAQLVAEYDPRWKDALNKLGSSYDLYTTTTTPIHKKLTQDFFVKFAEQGLLKLDSTEQYYSETENRFLPDRYVEGTCPKCGANGARSDQCDGCGSVLSEGELIDPKSKVTGSPVTLKTTQHYFIDWPKLQPFLEKYVDETSPTWRNWITAETKKWLKEGVRARAITRDLDWGIEIPTDRLPEKLRIKDASNKRIYVWFDAVIGYLSASMEWAEKENGRDWNTFWHNDAAHHLYFVGKDNLVFHTLFWPGQLHGYDKTLNLPDAQGICQFMTLEGKKLSKSRGIHLDPLELASKYGLDAVRFYFAAISPETSDCDFNYADFSSRVNSVLVANLGNFVNRTLKLAENISLSSDSIDPKLTKLVDDSLKAAHEKMMVASIRGYVEELVSLGMTANKLITEIAPWKHKDKASPEFRKAISDCVYLVLAIGAMISPVTPTAFDKLKTVLGVDNIPLCSDSLKELVSKIAVTKAEPLYSRIEQPETTQGVGDALRMATDALRKEPS